MQIESIIIQRLSERGRVQIPSWGTFYLMEKPARWDAVTNTAFPRGKYVGFTPSNTTTENSLLPAVMKQMRCTMEIAESWIARKVNQWQSTLDSGSILLLQGLGSFRKNDAFVAEKNNQFDAHSFGFSSVMLYSLNEPSALESKVAASLKLVAEQRSEGIKLWRKAAVAAAISALVTLGVYQSDLPTEMAGWFTPERIIQLDHSDRTPSTEYPIEEENELETRTTDSVISSTVAPPPIIRKATSTKKYYIIVGSFKMEDNAKTLAKDLQKDGMDVSILPGSLLKVGIGNYLSREAAKEDLAQIQGKINQHSWIYAY
jgi:nucleoid DNA-binding protein